MLKLPSRAGGAEGGYSRTGEVRGWVFSDLIERLRQILNNVIDMFGADAQSDGGRRDVLLSQFLF